MRKLIENWEKSKKLKQFKDELERLRNTFFQINDNIMNEELTTEEFEEMIDILIESYLDKKLMFEEINDLQLQSIGDKEEILERHRINLNIWYVFLLNFHKAEEYIICKKIKDIILLEKVDFFDVIKEFRLDLYKDENFQLQINSHYRECEKKFKKQI